MSFTWNTLKAAVNMGSTSASFVLLALIVLELFVFQYFVAQSLFEYSEIRSTVVYAPAVTSDGKGVLSKITLIIAYPGNGRVFFSALPYTEVETQGAARIAAYIASIVAGLDFNTYDYYVLIESSSPLIGGPSAGGLMTVGFTAILLNLTIHENITMTGMINPDGSIGPVGGLLEKLQAAGTMGYNVFLIPAGQRIYKYPVYEEVRRGPFTIRRLRYEVVDLVEYGEELGVRVIEVSNLAEVLFYFTGANFSTIDPLLSLDTAIYKEYASSHIIYLIENITLVLGEATRIAQKLGVRGYNYLQAIRNINSTLSNILSVKDTYPVYALFSTISLYIDSLRVFWLLQINNGLLTPDDLLVYVNNSLARIINELHNGECTFENSIIQTYALRSLLHFSMAINSTDTSSFIAHLADAIKYSELSKAHKELLKDTKTTLNCTITKYLELYSHALGSYTYVSRILEEMGFDTSALSETNYYVEVLNNAYTLESPAIQATTGMIISHLTMALYSSLGTTSTLLKSGMGLLSLYGRKEINPLSVLYIELYLEASMLDNVELSTLSLLHAITFQQVYSSTGIQVIKKASTYNSGIISKNTPRSETPITSTYIKEGENTAQGTGNWTWTNLILRNIEIVIFGFLIAIVFFLLTRVIKYVSSENTMKV